MWDELVRLLVEAVHNFQRDETEPAKRIVNHRQFERLAGLIERADGEIALGGKAYAETISIEPTIIVDPNTDSALMQEEIFGPILPVLGVGSLDEAIRFVNARPKPLASYLFTRSRYNRQRFLECISSGGTVINHIAVHCLVPHLPFGGVGNSGMGAYHGRWGFDASGPLDHVPAVHRPEAEADAEALLNAGVRMIRKTARGLDGRVVAITGGARGIGLATAQVLHKRGARVAIGDVDLDTAATAAASLGPDVLATRLDVTDEDSFAEFIAAVEDQLSPLDVLINNAGIMPVGPFLEEPTSLSLRTVDINIVGPLLGMRTVLPRMVKRGSGHVINVSSAAGKGPAPGALTYAATKAAVVALTETARVEFTGTGVYFTCVMPSFTNTDLITGTVGTKFIRNVEPAQVGKAIARSIARPRPDVFVPAVIGPIIKAEPLTGRRLRDWLNHRLGADRVFLDFDREARSAYQERIRG